MRSLMSLKMAFLKVNPFVRAKYGSIGKRSCIYKPLFVNGKKYIHLGNHVTFLNGARIEAISQYNGQKFNPIIEIGDNTSFQQNVHMISAGKLKIGSNCVFSSYIYISNCNHSIDDMETNVLHADLIVKETVIGNNCFVGTGVKIMAGVHIGDCVVVGANAVVTHDVPSFSMVAGVPARVIKKYDNKTKSWRNEKCH